MTFNPNEHLIKLQKKDYLEVKWRLAWFRDQCSNGTIETEIVMLDLDREVTAEVKVWNDEKRKYDITLKTAKGYCVCRAIVKDGNGGVGTGTKSEAAVDFGDFIEKAESGAIGRALATLGYGTQFTGDEFDERHRIVDSPVDRGDQQSEQAATAPKPAQKPQATPVSENKPEATIPHASDEQWNTIRTLCEKTGQIVPAVALNVHQANNVINRLQKKASESEKPAEQPFRPAGATEQAFTRMVEKCEEIAGKGKGQAAYQRIRKHVAGDLPDSQITDQHLTEMWTMINAAGKKPLAKTA